MSHPDDGRLRALLDEEMGSAEAGELRAHVARCGVCDAALRTAQETQVLATALLDALDVAPPVERVRARLAERRRAAPAPRVRRFGVGRGDLARAALLLLAFSGAVAAAVHPASPVHRWLTGEPEAASTVLAPTEEAPAAAAAPVREVGVRVAAGSAGVRIGLSGARPGSPIEVTWVDDPSAAVYAPEGTRFTTSEAEGRIAAELTSAGPVRVELPRAIARVDLVVDGAAYLEKRGERIEFPGPPALVDGPRVSFQVR